LTTLRHALLMQGIVLSKGHDPMKLTILVDNHTIIDTYLLGEPGVSFLIEDEDCKILFDTGYSDVFIKNALTLNLDLHALDAVVLSHGHNDHAWGLAHLARYYEDTHGPDCGRIKLVGHPAAFLPKRFEQLSIGADFPVDGYQRWMDKTECTTPYKLSDKLLFLGEIPRKNDFEGQKPIGMTIDCHGHEIEDYVRDDSALVYTSARGLVVMTGCSHSGICNIIEHACKVTGESRIAAVIGGFHLLNADPQTLERTCSHFALRQPEVLYPCHCTDLRAKIALDRVANVQEAGVGLVLDFG
jgi:7,8-dihydropterin-6-yl-methyl-4-(beta-D-ribofuranosyl)aminobenzene 5'-phosphate synthase